MIIPITSINLGWSREPKLECQNGSYQSAGIGGGREPGFGAPDLGGEMVLAIG